MTANGINALVDRLREQRNLSDAEFKTILETDAYDAACTCADSLSLRITAKITVTIVASVGITETRRATV